MDKNFNTNWHFQTKHRSWKKEKKGCLVYIHKPLIVATNNVSPQCALRASKMSEKLLTVKDLWRKKEEAEGWKEEEPSYLFFPPF